MGAFAVWRWLRRKPGPPAPVEEPDPRARELRAKLDESRADEQAEAPEAEPTVEERRADVHAKAREAIDELKD